MAIETVNGYICTNCSEVSQAKRGIDPQASASELNSNQKPDSKDAVRAPLDFSLLLDKLA